MLEYMNEAPSLNPRTSHTVSAGRRHRFLLGGASLLVGAIAGLILGLGIEAVTAQTSFSGIFGYGSYIGEPILLAATAALGLLFGLVGAIGILHEGLKATITPEHLTFTWSNARVRVRRGLIRCVDIDEDVVVYGDADVELARVPNTFSERELRSALTDLNYPTDADEQCRGLAWTAWTPGSMTEDWDRLLQARSRALTQGSDDVAEILRRQLAGMGVMVRDSRKGRRGRHQEFRFHSDRVHTESPALAA